jgi:integrase/recombinase XerD
MGLLLMLTLTEAVSEFDLALRAEGKAAATVSWYADVLRLLCQDYGAAALDSITAADMRSWFASCWQRGLARESVRSYHRAMCSFWNWCSLEYDIKSPMQNIRRPAPAKKQPKAYRPELVVRLFDACTQTMHPERNRAALVLPIDSSVRRGGMASMMTDKTDLIQRRALVTGKGGKVRNIYFTHFVSRLIRQWLNVRPESATKHLFVSRSGKPLQPGGFTQMYRRLKRIAGIQEPVNPHRGRHTFATVYLLNGGDIHSLAELAGWDTLEMAKEYAVFSERELQNFQRENSPIMSILNAYL